MRARLVVVLVLATFGRVYAEPSPPAPQTDAWSNVSHINGTPVPVGTRGDYLLNDPRHVTISTNPIGLLFGFYDLQLAAAVNQNVAIRADAEWMDFEFLGHTTGYELNAGMPIYLRRTFSGPFIEPGVIYRHTMDTPWDLFGDGNLMAVPHTFAGPQMLAGWQWMFDSGLNIAFAFGAARDLTGQHGSDSNVEPNGYLRVGMAF